jgi:hypothetical protein
LSPGNKPDPDPMKSFEGAQQQNQPGPKTRDCQQGALRGAPKYMEWYGAFGLMVTLIWLYLEMIRLLSKLRDRR